MDDRKNLKDLEKKTITGPYLDENLNPWINIQVKLATWVTVSAIIDTGFSGGLALPKFYESLFERKIPLYNTQFEYANGEQELCPIYTVRIKVYKKAYDTRLMFTNSSTALVGLKFLRDYEMYMKLEDKLIKLDKLTK